jgi:hypothetical protein
VNREIVSNWSDHAKQRAQVVADFTAFEETLRQTSSHLFENFLTLVRSSTQSSV